MIKTQFKPVGEIRHALGGARSAVVFSCGICANLADCGGAAGLSAVCALLSGWGVKVRAARCIYTCCSSQVMRQAMDMHFAPVRRDTDALVMVSCASGVKAAFLANPGVRVVAALDTLGGMAMGDQQDPVVQSLCTGCGACVLTFTGGICPRHACTKGLLYGPCKDHPQTPGPCAKDPDRPCGWALITAKTGVTGLSELRALHKTRNTAEPVVARPARDLPRPAKSLAGRLLSTLPARLDWVVRLVR